MMADIFHTPVKTVQNTEGPALGAAILAGVAAGLYESVPAACEALIQEGEPVNPIAENEAAYEKYYEMFRKLYPALKDSYAALAKL